mgnify:CR=1 FL=1
MNNEEFNNIRSSLYNNIENKLVDELFKRYFVIKKKYKLKEYEDVLEKVGKFIEIMLRVLEFITSSNYTSLNEKVSIKEIINKLENLPKKNYPDSIRIMIPRVLHTLYTFRSKRGGAHVKEITPYYIDATYTVHTVDWILSELLRLYHNKKISQEKVDSMVDKTIPPLERIQGDLVVLNRDLSTPKQILLILYENHPNFVEKSNLRDWIDTSKNNILVALNRLNKKAQIYKKDDKSIITKKGIKIVENDLINIEV